jgi:hypothetical protein
MNRLWHLGCPGIFASIDAQQAFILIPSAAAAECLLGRRTARKAVQNLVLLVEHALKPQDGALRVGARVLGQSVGRNGLSIGIPERISLFWSDWPSAVHVLLPVINLQIFFGRALVAKSEV